MAFTDKDEDTVLGIMLLGERSHSEPADTLQTNRTNESYSHHSDMVNVYNANNVSGSSTTGFGRSTFACQSQRFAVPLKRSTSSDNNQLQDFDIPKRKCLQRVQSVQNTRSNDVTDFPTVYNAGREERTTHNEHSQLSTVVNKIANMELEMKGLKAGHSKVSEGIKSLTENNKRLVERIEQLEVNGLCVVCYKDKINIWVNPCQHWVMCVTCYKKLSATLDENTGNRLKKCPVCRETINYALPYYGI